ncbi:hypothetical protein GCM10022232_70500 [Streptomyces plumbiresistens]|uniref:Transposase n=1 Tax=Streptomyces plumbiresistens TaxID=511811 RepID=A0ABP7SVG6_9ACTN
MAEGSKTRGTTTSGLLLQSNHYMWGLAHTYTPYARVARALACATRPYRSSGTRAAQTYRCDTCGDTVGATGRARGVPAQMGARSRSAGRRMADWGGTHEVATPAVKSTTMGAYVC